MTLREAIVKSNCGMAEKRSMRTVNRPIAMWIKAEEYRIVKSFTDPTVVRKLSWTEIGSTDWFPLNDERTYR